jgi:hypothetical protein
METYIVQSGWMGYAEMRHGEPELIVYRAGESFSTPPDVIHNVYLPAGAVIHTVKHGEAKGEARLEDHRTEGFTTKVRQISERDLLTRASQSVPRVASTEGADQYAGWYSPAYMHFDMLIWQVPAWSSAIFAVVLAGTSELDANSLIALTIGLPTGALLSCFYGLVGLFFLVLSHALYRFRWHQIRTKDYRPRCHLCSPQVGLQLIVNIQALVLFLLSSPLIGLTYGKALGTGALILAVLTVFLERKLILKGREGNKPIETRS